MRLGEQEETSNCDLSSEETMTYPGTRKEGCQDTAPALWGLQDKAETRRSPIPTAGILQKLSLATQEKPREQAEGEAQLSRTQKAGAFNKKGPSEAASPCVNCK